MSRTRIHAAGSLALALALMTLPREAALAAPEEHSLEPADFVLAHSGRQPADPWPEHFGAEIASGDFNGDGKTDLAVAAPDDGAPGDTSYGRGSVYVYWGGKAPYAADDLADEEADSVLRGTEFFAGFGLSLAAGDFDGDGRDDLAVGEIDLKRVHRGRVYIVSGARMASSPVLRMSEGDYLARIEGRSHGAEDGKWLWFGQETDAGDFNNDGIADIAIGAWAGDGVAGDRANAGEAVLYLGRRRWPRELVADPSGADVFLVGARRHGWFGYGVEALDLDGRGGDELVVASREDTIEPSPSKAGVLSILDFAAGPTPLPRSVRDTPLGLVWDLAASPAGTVVVGSVVNGRIGSSFDQAGGRSLAGGDIDGDGFEDLVFGAPNAGPYGPEARGAGAAYLLYGSPYVTRAGKLEAGSSAAPALLVGAADDGAGDAVRLGDVNADGRDDVILGLPGYGRGLGAIAVFAGRASRALTTGGDARVVGTRRGWRAGEDVIALDASFAGAGLLLAGIPGAFRRTDDIGRAGAGQVCGVEGAALLASVRPEPLVRTAELPELVKPGAAITIAVSVSGGVGAVSLELARTPRWARLEAAGNGAYRLRLAPGDSERGAQVLELVARDASGSAVRRDVSLLVGYAPSVDSVKLSGKRTPKLTILGEGFSRSDAVVLIDGAAYGPARFPSGSQADGGATSTTIVLRSEDIEDALEPGEAVTIRIRNPREGLLSSPFTFVP